MKLISLITLSMACLMLNPLAYSAERVALIYNGVSTCNGCPEAIATVAKAAHLSVQYVAEPKKIPALLNNAAIFIIGGTDDNLEPMQQAFNPRVIAAIKNYVSQGGNYLGICGGAYIAANHYIADEVKVKGFGLAPATAINDSETSEGRLETIRWLNKDVVLYFQSGPTFKLDKNSNNINVIATYRNGDIAGFKHIYGKGQVVLIGPHPEADKTWLEEDNIPDAHWQPQQALMVALLNDMLATTPDQTKGV